MLDGWLWGKEQHHRRYTSASSLLCFSVSIQQQLSSVRSSSVTPSSGPPLPALAQKRSFALRCERITTVSVALPVHAGVTWPTIQPNMV